MSGLFTSCATPASSSPAAAKRPCSSARSRSTRVIALKCSAKRPSSSDPRTGTPTVRSPSATCARPTSSSRSGRSEEHTSELQSRSDLVCRLLLEKKKKTKIQAQIERKHKYHRKEVTRRIPTDDAHQGMPSCCLVEPHCASADRRWITRQSRRRQR